MRLFSLCCLYILGQTTATPIAPASQEGDLAHAACANLDHRRLLSAAVDSSVRFAADVDSRDTITLRQWPFHLGSHSSHRECTLPNCIASSKARKSTHLPSGTVKMVSSLFCALMAAVGLVSLTALLLKRYRRLDGLPYREDDRQMDVVTTKKGLGSAVADEEVSEDFDDTDYPMG